MELELRAQVGMLLVNADNDETEEIRQFLAQALQTRIMSSTHRD